MNEKRWLGEGLLVGIIAGVASVIYRYCVTYAENGLYAVLHFVEGNILRTAVWFFVLILLACMVALLMRIEPGAGSSGVPQVMGEVRGKTDPSWWRVLAVKITAGTACIFGGLSLGRTGPSIQIGAMAAKGYSRIRRLEKNREYVLISCGAAAGLAATFHAPLAGLIFMLEEIQVKRDHTLFISGLTAVLSADLVSQICFGSGPVFSFSFQAILLRDFYLLIGFGIIMGLAGAFYNFVLLRASALFKRIKRIPKYISFSVVFLVSGGLGLVMPEVLAGGRSISAILQGQRPALYILLILLAVKFVFTILSAGSGVPGGLFFPLLILGALTGAVSGCVFVAFLGFPEYYYMQFIT